MWNNSEIQITWGRNKILDARRGGINEQFPAKIFTLVARESLYKCFNQNYHADISSSDFCKKTSVTSLFVNVKNTAKT